MPNLTTTLKPCNPETSQTTDLYYLCVMILQILTFGIARDIVGASTLQLETPEVLTVAQLKQQLLSEYPQFGALSSLLIAVNAEYGADDTLINERDELALIPPVSGG